MSEVESIDCEKGTYFMFRAKVFFQKDVSKSCILSTLMRHLLNYYYVVIVKKCEPPVDGR